MDKVFYYRAKGILKIVYTSWAELTKKREKHRKLNQIAAFFYLKSTYTKALESFKYHHSLCQRQYEFEANRNYKLASDCLQKWKKEFYFATVVNEIDFMRVKKLKQSVFAAFYKFAATNKFLRDTHNMIVLNRQERLKQKVLQALLMNVEEGRKYKRKLKIAEEHHHKSIDR